jgi:hypothetical protein
VDSHPTDIGPEVGEPVQLLFAIPPVEVSDPVGDEMPEIGTIGSRLPRKVAASSREPSAPEAGAQVGEYLVRNRDAKRRWSHRRTSLHVRSGDDRVSATDVPKGATAIGSTIGMPGYEDLDYRRDPPETLSGPLSILSKYVSYVSWSY